MCVCIYMHIHVCASTHTSYISHKCNIHLYSRVALKI